MPAVATRRGAGDAGSLAPSRRARSPARREASYSPGSTDGGARARACGHGERSRWLEGWRGRWARGAQQRASSAQFGRRVLLLGAYGQGDGRPRPRRSSDDGRRAGGQWPARTGGPSVGAWPAGVAAATARAPALAVACARRDAGPARPRSVSRHRETLLPAGIQRTVVGDALGQAASRDPLLPGRRPSAPRRSDWPRPVVHATCLRARAPPPAVLARPHTPSPPETATTAPTPPLSDRCRVPIGHRHETRTETRAVSVRP